MFSNVPPPHSKKGKTRKGKTMNTFVFIIGSILVLLWAANEIVTGFAKEAEKQCEKRRKPR